MRLSSYTIYELAIIHGMHTLFEQMFDKMSQANTEYNWIAQSKPGVLCVCFSTVLRNHAARLKSTNMQVKCEMNFMAFTKPVVSSENLLSRICSRQRIRLAGASAQSD